MANEQAKSEHGQGNGKPRPPAEPRDQAPQEQGLYTFFPVNARNRVKA